MMTQFVTILSDMRRTCSARASIRGALFTLALAGATRGAAQEAPIAGAQQATRAALAERVAQLEQQSSSGSLSGTARTRTMAELAAIRIRLQQGDFRVGDRFVITLRQDSVRSDTASVRDSLKVSVANLPDASLAGVLRSELDERMTTHVARYLRNVSVRTSVLTRVAILGAVRTPGFYYASPDRPISDLVMVAGGPAEQANLNELEVSRGTAKLLSVKDSRKAVKDGRTLEQLDVQSGDEVKIPIKRKINWQIVIQSMLVVSSLFFAGLQFLQWYYNRQDQ
jgi:protein involved in polysaccharide export with SLBB domain